jgi:catechol 2,3-dioxygenase-like lactoylglutathione lyase family enzyme
MNPTKLDHVAYWVADRDPVADFVTAHLGMHVIDRTETFTLVGSNARRGKLTLFDADGPRERGALKHVALRVSNLQAALGELPSGLDVDRPRAGEAYFDVGSEGVRLGLVEAGTPRVEVGGAYVEFHPGDPGAPERPLLNHLAVLVESADEHIAAANDLGVEVDNIVDAANTYAVFLWGPEHVRVEYVEHKPTFSLT